LIAGMVGETWQNWKDNIRKTIDLGPDSVTIYQMELPFNTIYSQDVLGNQIEIPVADWATKRAWVDHAFDELLAAGYHVSSAYTLVRDPAKVNFSYRDNLWRGSDMLATGIASFGHVSGVHYQNLAEWDQYIRPLAGRRPSASGPGPAADSPSVAGPRIDPAIETRVSGGRLFPEQIRRGDPGSLGGGLAATISRTDC
jgi:oxygen-independent coproporphyrinogen III oxidase